MKRPGRRKYSADAEGVFSRVECQVELTPDSLQKELQYMEDWAMKESDPLQKAVLMFLTGYYKLELYPEKMDSVLYYFNQAVKEKRPCRLYRL